MSKPKSTHNRTKIESLCTNHASVTTQNKILQKSCSIQNEPNIPVVKQIQYSEAISSAVDKSPQLNELSTSPTQKVEATEVKVLDVKEITLGEIATSVTAYKLDYKDMPPSDTKISISNSTKLLMDSSTQIPTSAHTTKLKGANKIDTSNGLYQNDTNKDPSNQNSVKVTSPLSAKTSVNEESTNIENVPCKMNSDKTAKQAEPSKIIKASDFAGNASFQKVILIHNELNNINLNFKL